MWTTGTLHMQTLFRTSIRSFSMGMDNLHVNQNATLTLFNRSPRLTTLNKHSSFLKALIQEPTRGQLVETLSCISSDVSEVALVNILSRTPNLMSIYVINASFQLLNDIASQTGGHLQELNALTPFTTYQWFSASHFGAFLGHFKCLRVLRLSHDIGHSQGTTASLSKVLAPPGEVSFVQLPCLQVLAIQRESNVPGLLTFFVEHNIRFVGY